MWPFSAALPGKDIVVSKINLVLLRQVFTIGLIITWAIGSRKLSGDAAIQDHHWRVKSLTSEEPSAGASAQFMFWSHPSAVEGRWSSRAEQVIKACDFLSFLPQVPVHINWCWGGICSGQMGKFFGEKTLLIIGSSPKTQLSLLTRVLALFYYSYISSGKVHSPAILL